MATATPRSLKTRAPAVPGSSSDCSKPCKAIVAAPAVPREGWPALIRCIPGGSLGIPRTFSIPLPVASPLQEKVQSGSWSRTFTVTVPGLSSRLSPGSAWGKSPVPICATATGAWGQPRAFRRPLLLHMAGCWLRGCWAALPCLTISGRPQLGSGVLFWHSSVASFCISRRASVWSLWRADTVLRSSSF